MVVLRLEQAEARAAVPSAMWWWLLSRRVILGRDSDVRCVAEDNVLVNSRFEVEGAAIVSWDDRRAFGQLRVYANMSAVAVPI